MLQSLALTFHMRRFFDEGSSGERSERDILALSDDQSWATYQHVRTMCEYFTQPIRAFLEGGENPLWTPDPAPMSKGSPNPSGLSALSQFPGIAETGLTWPTFHAYVDWLVGTFRSYLATIVQRLGPGLVHVGFAVTTDAWEALRRHGDPTVLPAENREPLRSSYSNSDEPQQYTYDVERAGVPLLIDVMLPQILDAIAAAESERPPAARLDHPSLADAAAESDRLAAAAQQAGDLDAAEDHFRAALELRRRLGDVVGEAQSWRQLGALSLMRGDEPTAEKHYLSALALADKSEDSAGGAETLVQLGHLAIGRSDHAQALEYFLRAASISADLGDDAAQIPALQQTATLERELGRLDQAELHFRTAREISERIGDRESSEASRRALDDIASERDPQPFDSGSSA